MLEMDRTYAGWTHDTNTVRKTKLPNGLLSLRFVMDKNSLELFVNDGEKVLSTAFFTPLSADRVVFAADGFVELSIRKYDFLQLRKETVR